MTSVVFVDDDSAVLRSMRMAFQRLCADWRLLFVDSAAAALEAMAKDPFDAIVSDLRMPGMDGAELLGFVRTQYPRTARIVLTGAADAETMERARAVSDEILFKPCSLSVVRACIVRLVAEST